ncbi:uncharacterized protein LOC141913884 isoform X2 [Tubulanus polymorphus]|uniref:uncharacterized protein LOC141913884 isoform X2 n=1 Tax=Tubulanus polymorphus TaxID=672921 RepID=UPI003DA67E8F
MLSHQQISDYKQTIDHFLKDKSLPADTVNQWDGLWNYVSADCSYPLPVINEILPNYAKTPCIFIHGIPNLQVNKVRKTRKISNSASTVTPPIGGRRPSDQELDVSGSPLKMQYLVELGGDRSAPYRQYSVTSECNDAVLTGGVDINVARRILSCFMLTIRERRQQCDDCPSLCVLSNRDDVNKTVCLIAKSRRNEDSSRIDVDALNITCEDGPTACPDQRQKQLQQIVDELFLRSKTTLKQASILCTSEYAVVTPITQFDEPPFEEQNPAQQQQWNVGCPSYMNVSFQWKTCRKLMEKPPPDSNAFIKVTAVPGDERNISRFLYREITYLKLAVDGLKSRKLFLLTDSKDLFLLKKIKKLLRESVAEATSGAASKIHRADQQQTENDDDPNEAASDNSLFKFLKKREFSLTEKLWSLLLGCCSFSELVSCLELIFTELKSESAKDLTLLLNANDSTPIAKLIKMDNYSAPLLTESDPEPIKILLEMGLLKIREDYKTVLIDVDLEERIARAEKLHHCVEIVSMLKQYISLPDSILTLTTRHILSYYEKHPFDANHEFVIPVKGKLLQILSTIYQPMRWSVKVSCTHRDTGEPLSTVWLADNNQTIFPHLPNNNFTSSSSDTDDSVQPYQYYKLTEIRNTFPI